MRKKEIKQIGGENGMKEGSKMKKLSKEKKERNKRGRQRMTKGRQQEINSENESF